MTKITLKYTLSPEAQRAELAAGRPAHAERAIDLEPTPELTRIAKIAPDGTATIERYVTNVDDRGCYGDSVPGYAVVLHQADHVLSDQADACAFLHECQLAVDAKCHQIATERRDRDAAREAERAANSARVLALAVDDVYDADGEHLGPSLGGVLTEEAQEHARAIRAEAQRRRDAAHERPEVEARAWAAENGECVLGSLPLQRAATEGRRVRREIARLVEARVREYLGASLAGGAALLPEFYGSETRDDVPTAEAYALRDRLVSEAPGLSAAAALPGTQIGYSDVCRIDVKPTGSAEWRTGVIVKVQHPWLTEEIRLAVLCASEAENLPGETEEDDAY